MSASVTVSSPRVAAGITKKAGCDTLRHTFATYKAEKGVSPFQLQQWLGHANLNTTQIYVHLGKQNGQKDHGANKSGMRRYLKHRPYQFTRAPQAIRRATLDNIAIVPASMVLCKETVTGLLNGLPPGGVILCHTQANTKQKKLLEPVGRRFQEQGHAVMSLPMEWIAKAS